MATRLIDLSLLSGREAQHVRALLAKNKISVYETPSGNWGSSMAAIWLSDESQLEKAQTLLTEYRQTQSRMSTRSFTRRKTATKIPEGLLPGRRFLLALSVAGGVVFLAVIVLLIGERIPLGRNFDARGGMIELSFLWAILFLFCVVWAILYFVLRHRKNKTKGKTTEY